VRSAIEGSSLATRQGASCRAEDLEPLENAKRSCHRQTQAFGFADLAHDRIRAEPLAAQEVSHGFSQATAKEQSEKTGVREADQRE
jgi:hypothetical protein